MTGIQFYIVVLLVYFGTDLIATWGLNLQFGVTGVLNFAYIVVLAVGAYSYGLLTLGPDTANGGFQSYFAGASLPPALAIVVATVIGCAAGGLIGLIGLKRLRPDYQAIALLVVSIVALTVAGADTGLVNGNPGITLIPNPFGGTGATGGGWRYVALVFIVCGLSYLVLRKFTDGPVGRTLRAVRDDDVAALAIGKNVIRMRILVQVVGGGFAALSGALLAGYVGAWSPSAWQYVETMSLLTAVIVGGVASNSGVVAGTLLVPVILQQGSSYLPSIASRPGLAEDIGWMITALLTIGFIWFRPRGIIPERRPRYLGRLAGGAAGGPGEQRVRPARLHRLGAGALASARIRPRDASPGPRPAAATGPAARPGAGLQAGSAAASPASAAERPAGRPLVIRGLVVRFSGVRAVADASFTAEPAAITGLIGPNGAGKSTLINAVSGFVRPDSGQVLLGAADITHDPPHRRARRGLVRTFQLPRYFGGLTTMENLLVAAAGQRAETAVGVLAGRPYWRDQEAASITRARDLLELFEMSAKADDLPQQLSGGQQRMLELMRGLMTDPQMMLLDEPTAGLSPRWSGMLEEALTELRSRGIGFVLVEHELGLVERVCDTVVVMSQGRVLSRGSMSELRSQEEVQAAYVMG